MTPPQVALLFAGLALDLIYFTQMLRRFHRLKGLAGAKLAEWSRASELSFLENWAFLTVLMVYAVWCGWQVVRNPASAAGFRSLLVLLFVLANAPRWNVVLGKAGVVHRLKFVPWQTVKARTVIPLKSRTLLVLRLDDGLTTSPPKMLTIPVPKKVNLCLRELSFF